MCLTSVFASLLYISILQRIRQTSLHVWWCFTHSVASLVRLLSSGLWRADVRVSVSVSVCMQKAEAKLSDVRYGTKSSGLVRRDCRANTAVG